MKYAIIKENKCVFIDDDGERLKRTLAFLPQYSESDIRELEDDAVEQAYTGEWYLKGYAPIRPDEETKALRAEAYANEVDVITAHIQRLRDENPVPEGEIAELIAEREAKVAEIKERYPYDESSSD